MPKPKLHVVGLPHTVSSSKYSHCAFTGKALRFAKMMNIYGWRVVDYSNGESESEAEEKVQILSADELRAMSKRLTETEDYSADIHNGALVAEFTRRVVEALRANVADGDIVCHVFGPNGDYMAAAPAALHVESGIGYTCTEGVCPYRVYETAIWMHWHLGRRHMEWGKNYEFVAPNFYDLDDWPVSPDPPADPYVLFFGRITDSKGLLVICSIAQKMPDMQFVLCGQGDPSPWVGGDNPPPNVRAIPPISGRARAALLGSASVVLAPTMFIEPFCGSAVEAQLCGTPVVTAGYGAFWETVEDGVTGFRCNILADYVGAIRRALKLDRRAVAARARALYSLEAVGKTYDAIFHNIADLRGLGWYCPRSHKFNSVEFEPEPPAPKQAAAPEPAAPKPPPPPEPKPPTKPAPEPAAPEPGYDYDWVEIGVGDFNTRGLDPRRIERGALVEPVAEYLGNLPDGPNIKKVGAAVCNTDGCAPVYYLDPGTIKAHGLPAYLRGCNRMYSPHPLVLEELKARGLPPTLVRKVVPTLTWASLVARLNAGRIKNLKVSTEGQECEIIDQVLSFGLARPDLLPLRLEFVANANSDPDDVALAISDLAARGYTIAPRGVDTDVVVATRGGAAAPRLLPKVILYTEDDWALGRISGAVVRGVATADVRFMGWGSDWHQRMATNNNELNPDFDLCITQGMPSASNMPPGDLRHVSICHGICELESGQWAKHSQTVLERSGHVAVGAVSLELVRRLTAQGHCAMLTPCGVDTETFTPPAVARSAKAPLKVLIPFCMKTQFCHFEVKRCSLGQRLIDHYAVAGSPVEVHDLARRYEIEEMPDVYRRADVVLILSKSEGNPLAILEGGASGATVLSTPVGIVPELVTDGVEGFILEGETDDELFAEAVQILDRLGGDRALVRSAQAALRARVLAERSLPATTKHWEIFIKTALENIGTATEWARVWAAREAEATERRVQKWNRTMAALD